MYKCINKMGASPCISDSRYNRDSISGMIGGRVVRKNRFVPFGKTTKWVGPESRKFFEPVDDAAIANDKADYQWLLKECARLNIDLPDDVTLCELGEAYNKYDPRLAHVQIRRIKSHKRVLGLKPGKAPVPTPEPEKPAKPAEPTNKELQDELVKLGGSFNANDNKTKLKELIEAAKKDKGEGSPDGDPDKVE